ncbi:response regulator transcription factor [Streptomyces sp. 71268]|uniref:response regulator transcription factor n=1 Tax=Streptomyces sp. 71268 TaxID=3002640 RepID=UPI0023F6B1E0|nr:response regulator transcription factor [Streptomyces sp. 71268]WEV26225.1 response regulator transcription factor [Streptomyces sp. 71268]
MGRIVLVISSPSLHRRVGDALTAPGWGVASWTKTQRGRLAPAVDVAVVESRALAAEPSFARIGTRVIALVNGVSDPFWRSPSRQSVAGVVSRDDPDHGYVAAVREVLSGRGWISPELVPCVLAGPGAAQRPPAPQPPTAGRLTGREEDVAVLVAEGLSNPEIADRLSVELSTVKFHVSNVLRKLGCRSRAQLAAVFHAYDRNARPTAMK